MKQGLSYGRITLSYEDDYLRTLPLFTFSPFRHNGRKILPQISDRDALLILKIRGEKKISFADAYVEAICRGTCHDEIGEGRALIRWLKKRKLMIEWKKSDFKVRPFFDGADDLFSDSEDAFDREHSFSISPVKVLGRTIKLYVEDEAMITLLQISYGEEEDFLSLIRRYVARRIQWELWRAPAPTFLDWVKVEGKRPVFQKGQLGFRPCLPSHEEG